MIEIFDSKMGQVIVQSAPYCEGCQRYEPHARATLKVTEDGHVIHTSEGRYIKEGVSITCMHQYLCQSVAHELREKLEKEKTDENVL